MPTRTASAQWRGDLTGGTGTVSTQSGAVASANYSYPTRFEDKAGSNPEELMAASHAGCFAMAFAALLANHGHTPESVDTTAAVTLAEVDGKPTITTVELTTQARVPGIDGQTFQQIADEAKGFCPVTRALAGVTVSSQAELTG